MGRSSRSSKAALLCLAIAVCAGACQKASAPTPVTAAAAAPASGPGAPETAGTTGQLSILVPAGAVGDQYWIYVDGHIAGDGSRAAAARNGELLVMSAGNVDEHGRRTSHDGWDLLGSQHRQLSIRHERWGESLRAYLDGSPPDPDHVFKALNLNLEAGQHTVEVAYLSPTGLAASSAPTGTFPFVITRRYIQIIEPGQTTRFVAPIPDNWDNTDHAYPAVPAAFRLCAGRAGPPDADELDTRMQRFSDDPVVKALRVAVASAAPGQHTAELSLPAADGGPREFNGDQIRYLAKAVRVVTGLPTGDDVAQCQNRYPVFAKSYGEYGKALGDVSGDIQSFTALADQLGGPG